MKRRVAIIGAGRAGSAIGLALQDKGYKIVAASARSAESLDRAAERFLSAKVTADVGEAARLADLIILAVPDGAIEMVSNLIAAKGGWKAGDLAVHLSGATSLKVLKAAEKAGAFVASFHPNMSFAIPDLSAGAFTGIFFGVTALTRQAEEFLTDLSIQLGGKSIIVDDEHKPLYHAAACIVSNYLVTLINSAEEIYRFAGLSAEEGRRVFWPLLEGTLNNIRARGAVAALTGPIARGDGATISGHLGMLKERSPKEAALYAALGRRTIDIALERGSITRQKADELIKLLQGGIL